MRHNLAMHQLLQCMQFDLLANYDMISFPIQSSEVKADPCKVQNPTKEKRTNKSCSEFESTRQIYKFYINQKKS